MPLVTLILDAGTATTLRNALKTRITQLDDYLARKGEGLDHVEYTLTRDVRRDMAEALSAVEIALADPKGAA